MKLKTLKDLAKATAKEAQINIDDVLIDPWEIKAAAIKWVKFYGIKNAFLLMDFFNITEEDLE